MCGLTILRTLRLCDTCAQTHYIGGAQTDAELLETRWLRDEICSPRVSEVTEIKLSPAYIGDVDQCSLNIVDVKDTKNTRVT